MLVTEEAKQYVCGANKYLIITDDLESSDVSAWSESALPACLVAREHKSLT